MRSSKWIRFLGKNTHGNICHWLVRKKSSIFNARKSTSFQILCCVWEGVHQHPKSNEAWKDRIGWITSSQSYRDFDGISGESTEFEWNIFPGFDTLQLYGKVTDLLSRLGETPETCTGRILFILMFNDISCDKKDNEEECLANAKVVSIFAKKFGIEQWSFIGPGSEKEMVFYGREQPTRNLGQNRGKDVGIRWIWTVFHD